VSDASVEGSSDESLRLRIPEPVVERDPARFAELHVSAAGEVRRPAVDEDVRDMRDLCDGMVRVLDDECRAVGPWNGSLSADDMVAGLAATQEATYSSKPAAAPTVRRRAREMGVDLRDVRGSGRDGRIVDADLDSFVAAPARRARASDAPHEIVIRGLRRRISDRLTKAWTEIPHITYVDEVDATDLELLRSELNSRHGDDTTRLTLLPFLLRAIVLACREQPLLNANYDAPSGTLRVFDAVHVGIATQTADGLVVPVVRNVETRDPWDVAREITRLSVAGRKGRATREELTGSTITVSSLGALGGSSRHRSSTSPKWRSAGSISSSPAQRGVTG
jgi:pyruvate/2-oxoglutarate dehydrogenase complex dihydrolipoamide acyltransferase (E2) component